MPQDTVHFDGETAFSRYQVIDMTYEGRPARVLFTGNRTAAFSGIPKDNRPEMLFDYNQRLLEMVLDKRPQSILMIGGGVFTLPSEINKHLPATKIDAVEIDSGLLALAEKYFNFDQSNMINPIFLDGQTFIENCNQTYDVIIIDAFNGLDIPAGLSNTCTVRHLLRLTHPSGLLVYNIISSGQGRRAKPLRDLGSTLQRFFPLVAAHPADVGTSLWTPQNYLLFAQNESASGTYYQRYEAIALPQP
jgi:spermidine synthase